MYEIWLYPVETELEELDVDTRELINAQLEEWAVRVEFDRRSQPRGYSIAPVQTPDYRGAVCLIDHPHRSIIVLEFLRRV